MFNRVARLPPVRSQAEYDRTVAPMNVLLDIVGDKPDHALSPIFDLVGDWAADMRKINETLAGKMARYCNVSPAALVPTARVNVLCAECRTGIAGLPA